LWVILDFTLGLSQLIRRDFISAINLPITVPVSLVVEPIAATYPFKSSSDTPKVLAVAAALRIPSAKSFVVIA
jgi:hypothetical protein